MRSQKKLKVLLKSQPRTASKTETYFAENSLSIVTFWFNFNNEKWLMKFCLYSSPVQSNL